MEVHIYSLRTKTQAGNIRVKDTMTRKAKAERKSAEYLKNINFARKFSRVLQVQERVLLG